MFLAHSFRLRDPWQREAAEGSAVRWTRGFHRPTGLESDDALWLVISGLPAEAAVALNGHPLVASPPHPHGQFDVTTLLADSNQLEILLPSDLQPPASSLQSPFPFDVRLGVVGHS